MTHQSRKATALASGGLPNDHLAAKIKHPKAKWNDSGEAALVQGQNGAPLFHPRTRAEALRSAREFTDGARRCQAQARENPAQVARVLDRLAVRYVQLSAHFFACADSLPEMEARA